MLIINYTSIFNLDNVIAQLIFFLALINKSTLYSPGTPLMIIKPLHN